MVEIMHQKCNLQLVLSKSYKSPDSSPGGSFHQTLSPLSDIPPWIYLNFRSCRMMQWVGLAWCCLLLSSQVKSTLDPDQKSSPANATASQRALSVFSVVKVFFFLTKLKLHAIIFNSYFFSFQILPVPPPQQAGMEHVTPALSAPRTGKY